MHQLNMVPKADLSVLFDGLDHEFWLEEELAELEQFFEFVDINSLVSLYVFYVCLFLVSECGKVQLVLDFCGLISLP